MKALRIAVAALVGAIVIFVWGAVAHMALPLGQMGFKNLPEATANSLVGLQSRAIYIFPGIPDSDSKEATDAWEQRYKAGPRGIVVIDPEGGTPMSPSQLGSEFLSGLLCAVVLTALLLRSGLRLLTGPLLGAALGLFAWSSIDLSQMIWYRFPQEFTTAALIEQVVGWLLAGLAIGVALPKKKAQEEPLPEVAPVVPVVTPPDVTP